MIGFASVSCGFGFIWLDLVFVVVRGGSVLVFRLLILLIFGIITLDLLWVVGFGFAVGFWFVRAYCCWVWACVFDTVEFALTCGGGCCYIIVCISWFWTYWCVFALDFAFVSFLSACLLVFDAFGFSFC